MIERTPVNGHSAVFLYLSYQANIQELQQAVWQDTAAVGIHEHNTASDERGFP